MLKRAGIFGVFLSALSALAVLSIGSAKAAAAQAEVEPIYAIKQSDVRVPPGIALGQYRRITEPFPNWTLICDENLKTKQRVCNITQNIVDDAGASVFSWSLAATQNGQPLLILRVPPQSGADAVIHLGLNDGGEIVPVKISACDQNVCVAYQNIGPRLRAAIKKGTSVEVIFNDGTHTKDVAFRTPLVGLSSAFSGIR